jgi:hypothetical protein
MVLPVTGPVNKTIGTSTSPYKRFQAIYKQARPIDRALPYTGYSRNLRNATRAGFYDGDSDVFGVWLPNQQSGYQYAINETGSKLRGKVSDQALWSANLAEYNSSLVMMEQRFVQLGRFLRAFLKRDLYGMYKAFGGGGKTNLTTLPKRLADLWLEFSFGWKPLAEDVYSAVVLLQNPIKATHVSARRTYGVADVVDIGNASIGSHRVTTGTDVCLMRCDVTISNPNLYLANNLGLANPAEVIWELVPFSFAVDWFISVGTFLSSGSAWLGLTVTNPSTTFGSVRTSVKNSWNVFSTPMTWSTATTAHWVQRKTELTSAQIIVKPQRLWAWERAANAAAVATQLFSAVR